MLRPLIVYTLLFIITFYCIVRACTYANGTLRYHTVLLCLRDDYAIMYI